MSYAERENLISLFTNILVSIPYYIFILGRYGATDFASSTEEFKFWATAFLLMIPLRIVAEIIMHIVAAILQAIVTQEEPEVDDKKDERDKLIDLKSTRNSHYSFVLGLILAFLALAVTGSPTWMFVIFIVAGSLSELMEIGSKIYYYGRGI